jgi:hypothetical protein
VGSPRARPARTETHDRRVKSQSATGKEPIAGHLALDAFHHPYAYVQSHENHGDRIPQTT